jgi:hypothetical protein
MPVSTGMTSNSLGARAVIPGKAGTSIAETGRQRKSTDKERRIWKNPATAAS